jgi:hypothetical protein
MNVRIWGAKGWTEVTPERLAELYEQYELQDVQVAGAVFPAWCNTPTETKLLELAGIAEPTYTTADHHPRVWVDVLQLPTLCLIDSTLYHVDDPRVVCLNGEYQLAALFMVGALVKPHGKGWRYATL